MNRERSGRVTFMPLNRLKSIAVLYPKANDALPMISKLKFDRAYVMAFEQVRWFAGQPSPVLTLYQVFGRTIICEDLATAAQYTRSHGLNAVTVEGDRADRKGALTGGYHDVRRSRIDSAKAVKKWREAYENDSSRHVEVKEGITRVEQQITQTMGQVQVLEARRKQILDTRAMSLTQSNWAVREEEQSRQRVGKLESALAEAEGELKDAAAKRTSHEEELSTPMRQQLTDAEVQSLERLTRESEEQKQTLVEASHARQKVGHTIEEPMTLTCKRHLQTVVSSRSSSPKTCGDSEQSFGESWTTLKAMLEAVFYKPARSSCGTTSCGT